MYPCEHCEAGQTTGTADTMFGRGSYLHETCIPEFVRDSVESLLIEAKELLSDPRANYPALRRAKEYVQRGLNETSWHL